MVERRLRCALVRTCDIRTANRAVSICLYILLTDIYEMPSLCDLSPGRLRVRFPSGAQKHFSEFVIKLE